MAFLICQMIFVICQITFKLLWTILHKITLISEPATYMRYPSMGGGSESLDGSLYWPSEKKLQHFAPHFAIFFYLILDIIISHILDINMVSFHFDFL
mgnify:CR=1 FL=1